MAFEGFCALPGDLFFQDLGDFPSLGAKPPQLRGYRGASVDHVGLFAVDPARGPGIIEAYPPRVRRTPLAVFLGRHLDSAGRPTVFVSRLAEANRKLIPGAIDYALAHLGAPYDDWFEEGEDAFYCSELIAAAFAAANGRRPVFQPAAMTFRDHNTGAVSDYWRRHFDRGHRPVPEGQPGSNPGALSRSLPAERGPRVWRAGRLARRTTGHRLAGYPASY